ncbi:N-acetylglucosaminyldiphosphodolichol N-acetylglucosaminyltransferase catalytic subunit alg13 [Coemansia nantahalensis]|uniref:N-acetylglucosaminyldiphosphodolichol N-acetylglucosaminyltransferase catalytic subunit alg13 n=1 Tax=Coemansia nantahalensis TaxID=2789366 RepID=A0ACC1K297_9FUNG|nr:N-acetylglucosaminyldiphosphodolichol N-acetylglucosaminyltransferase catalytic subunit alg13 [Coemansia nantahalensis]
MSVFVTVGSTGFDELVRAVCAPEFLQALTGRGFGRLVVQCGSSVGQFAPAPAALAASGIRAESFDYADQPQRLVEEAELVICHAGTGSILDALRSGKPVIGVVNPGLMDSHQREIAAELARGGFMAVAEPGSLVQAVADGAYAGLRPYPRADPRPLGDILDEETQR